MAPVASTIASHVEGVSDSARAREVYKYFQPTSTDPESLAEAVALGSPTDERSEGGRDINVKVRSNVTSSKISSPDTALTAFCQLITWRLGVQRAMISLIDAETQYFIAEGTKTVDLVDNRKHAPGDDLWLGCASVEKTGRLCEKTIAVPSATNGKYPSFIVNDLSKDDRFQNLPFVTEAPCLRFYAGVPLITHRGIPIGSLFVVDDRVRNGLSEEEVHFMGTMAATIMKHMEMVREAEEHRRGMKMSRGLASFVEGRAELVEAEVEAEDGEGTRIVGQFETDHVITKIRSRGSVRSSISHALADKENEYSSALFKSEEEFLAKNHPDGQARPDLDGMPQSQQSSYGGTSATMSSPNDANCSSASPYMEDSSEATSMKFLFSRAANLIREAFEVNGGVVFYDAQTGFSSDMSYSQRLNDDPSSHIESATESQAEFVAHTSADGDDHFSAEEEGGGKIPSLPILSPLGDGSPDFERISFSRTTTNPTKSCEILGFSTPDAASVNGDPVPGSESFCSLEEDTLMALLKRYPRGKLWNFDSDGAVSSSSDDERRRPLSKDPIERSKEARRRLLRSAKNKSDARLISRHFPGVRQLLFVPLWDAGPSRWLSGCFAWSTEPTRVLSKQSELAFLSAFGNSVMAEWSRLDTEIADQKKGDFIGSISHELRSPLHGILASAEFLEETTTGWEKGLVETIDSCGRTLLDTINHILDFSKINHFEKNWKKSKRAGGSRTTPGKSGGSLNLEQSDLPMLNLFQDIDISVLCEEVVESVFAGHVFQHTTAKTFDMVPDTHGKMSDARKSIPSTDNMLGPQKLQSSGVVVILDVAAHGYHFITQPGALRRLIMNLLGNALKYTSHGYVKITLSTTNMDDYQAGSSSAGTDGVPRSMVSLTVQDTGRGISPEFLRSKLFMPFAQENSVSSGTGLGLSIVRKIVSLLEGEITIDSEVGRGTRVRVTLPLLREMPRNIDSGASSNTQKSVVSVGREADEIVSSLRARAIGYRASLLGFDIETKDPVIHDMGRQLKNSITSFLVNWYGMRIVPLGQKCDILISNEGVSTLITKIVHQIGKLQKRLPSVVVLCSHDTRFMDRTMSVSEADFNVGFIAKPVGPLKLAKALSQCLQGVPSIGTPLVDGPTTNNSESTDLSNVFEGLSLSPRGGEVLDNSRMSADSANARKAIESPTPNGSEKHAEFPFPQPEGEKLTPKRRALANKENSQLGSENSDSSRLSLPDTPPAFSSTEATPTIETTLSSKPLTDPKAKLTSPTLLLVDDNQINIRLLSTYLHRRDYNVVHQAMDGLQAVQKVEARKEGYNIIFMDITMPILDGFGATRQIRAIEEKRRRDFMSKTDNSANEGLDMNMEDAPHAALIIAFTGRSSIEDQNEAVRVGIDLFMTKPVAFKEVGKIIDNWVANRERERRGIIG
ncbi:related to nik-1 protein (Os-1p protein) [Rhynchosporium agropyri]|uniref:histidine kinase n=1 Tax=Rhynchosporium agropyri TaxID=914238 RepID=A0A1E1KBT9_9HELO|nr:related to nik-1 protein (Os-1p protein) [Rhynchosporium agropyri]